MSGARHVINIFRLAGDFIHLFSIILLWMKMSRSRSCSGISLKSQILFLTVYATRYLDVLLIFHIRTAIQFYNLLMKIFFITSQTLILHSMLVKYRATYNPKLDTFKVEWVLVPCMVLAIFLQHSHGHGIFGLIREYFWTFSILLESVAILPQMFQLQKTGEAETITTHYLLCLGLYRAFYLLNWVYRWSYRESPELIAVVAGVLQTALYSDFFYIYYKRVFHGRAFKLPI